MRIFLKILSILLIVTLSLILIVVSANIGDEQLKPEAKAALAWQLPAHVFDDNGYLVLLGMDAPADQDAYEAGKKALQELATLYQNAQKNHKEPPINTSRSQNDQLFSDFKQYICDYRKTANCVDFYRQQNKAQLSKVFESVKFLESRYDAIKHHQNYIETVPPLLFALTFQHYEYLAYASELIRAKVTLETVNGNTDQGLQMLLENLSFSRRLLRATNTLVSRMIAVALMQKDLRILSELIAKYPQLAIQYNERLSLALIPIYTPEYSMKKVLTFERNWGLALLSRDIKEDLNYAYANSSIWGEQFVGLLYQPNATVNLFYDWGTIRLMMTETDAQHLDATYAKIEVQQKALLGFGYAFFYLKNPIAKILVQLSEGVYDDYIERQHDTDGYLRLVGLQITLAANKAVAQEQILKILPNFINPYTGKSLLFNNVSREIIFEGRQKSSIGETNIYKIKLPEAY